MVDAEKMSKSKGNFLMMTECCEEYSTDATRFSLADAGDGLEDANFDRSVANQAISYLFVEEEWIDSVLTDISSSSFLDSMTSPSSESFMEKAFNNELNYLIEMTKQDFLSLNYREGLHHCWYEMLINRDIYREWILKQNKSYNSALILRFIHSLTLMMAPITPHWCEMIFEKVQNHLKGREAAGVSGGMLGCCCGFSFLSFSFFLSLYLS
jgi:leucyl-tRNA synthetase